MPQDEEPAQPVPEGWEKRTSRSTGMVYYLNVHTKGESLLKFHKACEFHPEHFQNHNGKHPQRKPSHRASFRRSRHHIFSSSTPVLVDLRAGVRIPSQGRRKRLELFSKVTCRRSKRFVGSLFLLKINLISSRHFRAQNSQSLHRNTPTAVRTRKVAIWESSRYARAAVNFLLN